MVNNYFQPKKDKQLLNTSFSSGISLVNSEKPSSTFSKQTSRSSFEVVQGPETNSYRESDNNSTDSYEQVFNPQTFELPQDYKTDILAKI